MSDAQAAAPAFICRARPRGAASTRSAPDCAIFGTRIAAAAIHDHDAHSALAHRLQPREQRSEPRGFVEDRHHDGELACHVASDPGGVDVIRSRHAWNLPTQSRSRFGACARFQAPAAYLLASASVG